MRSLTVLVVLGLAAHPASAFCVDNNGSFGNATHKRDWLVLDDATSWIGAIDSPTLTTTNPDPLYWRNVIETAVDTAAQDWSRIARARLKTSFRSYSTTASRTDDSLNAIVVQACPDPNGFVAGIDMDFTNNTCDIYVRSGTCSSWSMATGAAGATGAASNFERSLSHEMGHCLGLGHPAVTGSCGASACGATLGCTEGQIMCQNTCGKLTDLPHSDDIDGHHQKTGGSPIVLPKRRVELRTGYYTTGNVYTDDQLINPGELLAVFPARLDCRHGSGNPECVMARVWSQDSASVRLDRLDFNGVGPTTATADTSNVTIGTHRPVDVALSHTQNVAVVVVAENDTSNQLLGVRVLRFDTSSITTLTSVVLDPSTDDDKTTFEPRVTFARGLGGISCTSDAQCASSTCNVADGMCVSPAAGRFVVGVVERSRRVSLWLSADAAGNGPYVKQSWVNTSNQATTFDPINENFDIHCPRHVAPNAVGDRTCRIVFTPTSTSTLDGTIRTCTVTMQTNGQTRIEGCAEGFAPQRGPSIGSLADYGTGAPATQRTARGWLTTIARRVPQINLTNSHQALYAHAGTTFSSGDLVHHNNYDIDSNTCTEFGGAFDEPRSFFGGSSLDYCEDCDRTVRTHLGSWVTPSFGDKCF